MDPNRRFVVLAFLMFGVSGMHAGLTWPVPATIALFVGGGIVVVLAEVAAFRYELVDHRIGPDIGGVPVYIPFGWTATVYILFRVVLLFTDAWLAAGVTAVLATLYDIPTEQYGLTQGLWRYTDEIPGPRFGGVPWWNYTAWLGISFLIAALAVPFLR